MIKGSDFVLNPEYLEEQYQLVEVSNWTDYNTSEHLGFYYTVILPKVTYEKMKVGIRKNPRLVSDEQLREKGSIMVSFTGLRTWGSLYDRRLSVKAEATSIRLIDTK